MSYSRPARRAAHRTSSTILAAAVVLGAAIVAVAASPLDLLPGDDSTPAVGSADAEAGAEADAGPAATDAGSGRPAREDSRPGRPPSMPLGEADGAVPDGVTVFDDDVPAVAQLDPDLLDALREAASDAADDGVEFVVNSGWRSAEYQEHLLREAVAEYGSEEEAARWVSTPETSLHVSGDAVDLGPSEATDWLSEHGAEYGLCQIYDNEPWHYELRPDAADDGCPRRYDDPTQDPRMQE
ncbi:peptidase M15 [Jiangella ureilytica]|uniref:Peptidase M15 n=1 Tax=Jiangella ureilytica TaxID=2530374 RepID=A0A4R4RPJ3_9ACTN|nr:M15 family metallopeptidase [Jiangella ureilytica]TDC51059.1 peptidase M15 [Jiangella ureilytica]